jgi:hypothetical protein
MLLLYFYVLVNYLVLFVYLLQMLFAVVHLTITTPHNYGQCDTHVHLTITTPHNYGQCDTHVHLTITTPHNYGQCDTHVLFNSECDGLLVHNSV